MIKKKIYVRSGYMVSIITPTMKQQFMDNIFENYKNQNWEEKELIIILNHDEMNISKWKKKAKKYRNVSIYQLPQEATLGECLNYGVERAKFDYIAKFDDDDYYSPNYLIEQMQYFEYYDIDIVGKRSVYMFIESKKTLGVRNQNNEHKYTKSVRGPTIMFRKEVFNEVQFCPKNQGEDVHFLQDCRQNGYKVYSTSRYNFTYIRRANENHTTKRNDDQLLNELSNVCITDDFKSIVKKKIDGGEK